jgi:hypothetical protein
MFSLVWTVITILPPVVLVLDLLLVLDSSHAWSGRLQQQQQHHRFRHHEDRLVHFRWPPRPQTSCCLRILAAKDDKSNNSASATQNSDTSSSKNSSKSDKDDDHRDDTPMCKNTLLILGIGRVGKEVARQVLLTVADSMDVDVTSTATRTETSTSRSTTTTRTLNRHSWRVFGTVRLLVDGDDTRATTTCADNVNTNDSDGTITLIDWNNVDEILRVVRDEGVTHVLVTIPPVVSMSSSLPTSQPQSSGTNDNDIDNSATAAVFDRVVQELVVVPNDDRSQTVTSSGNCVVVWFGLVSTTGVYGNHDGGWVTEESLICTTHTNIVLPTSTSSQNRYLSYEDEWIERILQVNKQSMKDKSVADANEKAATGRNSSTTTTALAVLRIFRCAGIYSPHQSALHSVYKQQQQQYEALSRSSPPPNEAVTSLSSVSTASTAAKAKTATPSNVNSTANAVAPMNASVANAASAASHSDITNRIHVHDLAAAIVASMMQTTEHVSAIAAASATADHDFVDTIGNGHSHSPVEYYNLADNEPESRTVVFEYACQLLQRVGAMTADGGTSTSAGTGTAMDTVDSATTATTNEATGRSVSTRSQKTATTNTTLRAQRRQSDQKRVSNAKMRRELLPTLKYPTYKEGLAEILHDRSNPWWRNGRDVQT